MNSGEPKKKPEIDPAKPTKPEIEPIHPAEPSSPISPQASTSFDNSIYENV